MKAKVLSSFLDKYTYLEHKKGEVIDLTDKARIDDLVSRGLIEVEKVAKAEKSEETPVVKKTTRKSAKK